MNAASWRATLSATAAILIGIGLARFAYTPLIPALVAAQWFAPADAAYLGAANLAGYLLGAIFARAAASRISLALLMRGGMAAATISFFACALPLPFWWFFAWRFASGIAGAVLMVLAAPAVLPLVPEARRGLAGGVIFTGVGIGIAASGTLVPLLLRLGLTATWCGLGVLAAVLSLAAWSGWPRERAPVPQNPSSGGATSRPLNALYLSYALNAVGLVPHMVFLVDFVARGLGAGIAAGANQWVLFGAGALVGPVLLGRLADLIGFARAVRLAYVVEAALVASVAVLPSPIVLAVSSVVVGAFVPGITTLVLGRARELLPGDAARQQTAWTIATAAWALGQAAGSWGMSMLYARLGVYPPLFALAAAALAAAFAVDYAARPRSSP